MENYIDLGLSVMWENTDNKLITRDLPTKEQIRELLDNCKWTPTSTNNIEGYEIIGNNGNSIFIPFPKVINQSSNILKTKNLFDPIIKRLIMNMVFVEGGTFLMGAQSADPNAPNYDSEAESRESPVHSVTVGDFCIGKYEVTQQLWEYVMNYSGTCADGSSMSAYASDVWLGSNPSTTYGLGDNYPAYYVSWDDIVNVFIPRLNKITGKTFRLPTEAEWEYAARGGNRSKGYKYSGGNTIDEVAWYSVNSSGKTHEVGIKKPNELGLYDMSGNVWEWCSDWYSSSYYSSSPTANPAGPASGSRRVIRGDGWARHYADFFSVASRGNSTPDFRDNYVGFRLVCTEI